MVKKVVIVGAGPSGVLLAHYLLGRDKQYDVDIYERRSDPHTIEISKTRAFPLVINERGLKALSNIQGVVEAVKAVSVKVTGLLTHQKNGRTRFLPRQKPIFSLDRTQLVMTLLVALTEKYGNNRLNIHFDHQCKQVDFEAKTVKFENVAAGNPAAEIDVNYDLLIGADGAQSHVREQLLSTNLFEVEQKYIPSAYKSISLPAQESLKSGNVHAWRANDGISVILVHQVDGALNGTVTFPRENNFIANLSTTEEVLQFFRDRFPELSQVLPESEAEAFLHRPISKVLTIRCNRYHYGDSVLLIGDAAHATSPSLGQGCNASFEDVALLDELLDEYSDDVAQAISQFTLRRQPDAHALVELSDYAFPLSGKLLFVEFLIRLRAAQFLHQLFPKRFPLPLFQLVSETTIPYAEILSSHKGWIAKVKQANEKSLMKTRRSQTFS